MKLIVMAKAPQPGRVKTRLCPPCTPMQAAWLARAAIADTLAASQASGADEVVVALDGAPGDWIPSGVRVVEQRGDRFDQRLANAWSDVGGPAFQIGMDTPQIEAALLDGAMARLDDPTLDATLGPAADGGWWGLGLRRANPSVFLGVPMSRPDTGTAQLARLVRLGLHTEVLTRLTDIDTIDDARHVAAAHPKTRFAEMLARCDLDAA